jgi:hypothetical protein
MARSAIKLLMLSVMVIAGVVGLYRYERNSCLVTQLEQEKQKSKKLEEVVTHLQAQDRVADVIVTDQHEVNGVLQTTLLFVEYAKDGSPLPAKRFTFEGKTAHLDAMVVNFDGHYVADRDPLRGKSIALFTRIFGDKQTPESAARIDEPGHIPAIYQGVDPKVSQFEQDLWKDFWRLADDEAYRKSMGVRATGGAQGEAVWRPFEPGKLYTVTLQHDGGLSITSEPLKGIYSEALKRNAEAKAAP